MATLPAGEGLGGNDDLLLARPEHVSDDTLTFAIAVSGCGIDQRHPEIQRTVQGCDRILLTLWTPTAANCPGSKADFGNILSVFT